MERRGQRAQQAMPAGLRELPLTELPLLPVGLVGLAAIARLFATAPVGDEPQGDSASPPVDLPALASLIPALEQGAHGVIMTMGKGGVGKTMVAVSIAVELVRRGHRVAA